MSVNSKYIVGDSRALKQIFKENNLKKPNVIVSSPPYFDVLNYNDNNLQIGYGQTNYSEYLSDVCNVFQECYDLSSKNASFWLIVDTFKKDGVIKTLPFDIVTTLLGLRKKTWLLKEIIVWDKEKNLPWNGHGKFRNQFEYILLFTKQNEFYFSIDEVREINDLKKWWKTYPERYNPNGKAPSNLWSFTTTIQGWGENKQEHLCPLPFPLIEKIFTISTKEGDTVFDPFAGSGSLIALAEVMGRNAYGIDINQEYKVLFEEQVKIGAQDYWKRREIELDNNKSYITNFKTTNRILRIHKVTSLIVEEIFNENVDAIFKPVISTSNIEDPSFTIKLLSDEHLSIPLFSEATNKVIKQAKVIPIVEMLTYEEFYLQRANFPATFYKYTAPKIYSYTTNVQYQTLRRKQETNAGNIFYSPFELKIK